MMLRTVSLGATTVATVDNPIKCPPGTWSQPVVIPNVGIAYYECNSGEPWTCEWFGWGCKGVPVAAPAAPSTEQQMRDPLSWTPEDSVNATWRKQQDIAQWWLHNTTGIARTQSGVYRAGEAVKDAIPDADTVINWTLVGLLLLGSAAMVVIKLKR